MSSNNQYSRLQRVMDLTQRFSFFRRAKIRLEFLRREYGDWVFVGLYIAYLGIVVNYILKA